MNVTKWFAVALLLVFGLTGIAVAKEKKSAPKKEQWKSYAKNELSECYLDLNSIKMSHYAGQEYEVNTKIVPTKVGRLTKEFAYKELTAIAYVNIKDHTTKRDVLKIVQFNGKMKVEVVNEYPRSPSQQELGWHLLIEVEYQLNDNKRKAAEKIKKAEQVINRDSIDKDITILPKPELHVGNIEEAKLEFPKTGTAPDSSWFTYATPCYKYCGEYSFDVTSVAFDQKLGVVTANVSVNYEGDVASGKALLDLKKNTVTKDADLKYKNNVGEVDRELKIYSVDNEFEKILILHLRKWAATYFAEHPDDAAAYGPIAALPAERWMRYASAQWANFYYDADSFKMADDASGFVIKVKAASTEYGLKPEVQEDLKKRGWRSFKTRTVPASVNFEGKKITSYNDYNLGLNDSLFNIREYWEWEEDYMYKKDREIFAIVERCAKDYFAKNPTAMKAYKAKQPKSRLFK